MCKDFLIKTACYMHKHQNRQTVDCVVSNRNLTTSLVHRVMDSLVSNISCVGFQEQNIIISLINIASASVSFLVSVFVAATILLFKKYVIFTQRLILYLCITAGLYSIAIATGAGPLFPNRDYYDFTAYCSWSGFSMQQTGFMFFIATFVVICDMYLRVVKQKDTTRFEIHYLLAITVLPLIITWIPFIESTYGDVGPWCWIRLYDNNNNCTTNILGLVLRITAVYVPLSVGSMVAILLYILMVRHLYRLKYTGKYDPQKEALRKLRLKEAKPFLIFLWVYLAIVTVSFISNLIGFFVTSDPNIYLVSQSFNACIGSLQGAVTAIVYGLDLETLRRLVQAKHYPCCWHQKIREYPITIPERTDSYIDQEKVAAYTAAMYMCQLEK